MKRKIDNRIRILIENGISTGFRTFFVVVGDKSRDQVVYLHHILSKSNLKQANVLWCYKKNLAFSSHRGKRMKQLKAKQQYGNAEINEDDPLEMFVSMTDIRYCYYKETHKILGNTFKMCVLQDFEAMTPNILCRTIETVEGGGVVVLLLQSVTSLKQLYTLNMDVHSRYRTEAHQHVVPRFNERFILSLASCPACIVLNDQLQILPISSLTKEIEALPFSHTDKHLSAKEVELKSMKDSTKETQPLGTLVGLCKTLDQAKVLSEFMTAITEKTLASTITLTAARGRGKSAAMGLALAGAISVGYANMYVTSPSPENLNTFFEFLLKGIDALGYEKHIHYETLLSSQSEHNKSVMRLTIKKDHRQIVQYISPSECDVLDNAELLVIDEAAAIPLPQVQSLLGPYLVFLASTISGYEGTGRSLSLKLIKQLREQSAGKENLKLDGLASNRNLVELSLKESIRYKNGDHVEKWLYDLLCLESSAVPLKEILPQPQECDLYYVNRDTLFGYHKISEKFLKTIMSLLVSSHYRNTPDDLQTLSDAPAHHIFALLPPTDSSSGIPQVFCVVQVALEGKISKAALDTSQNKTKKPSGDLIPWTVSNLFQDKDFPQLSGARIVRIATHPDLQGRGYGSRALILLEQYYNQSAWRASVQEVAPLVENLAVNCVQEEEVGLLHESVVPKAVSHPLLLSTSEREAEPLHYLGVSFGASFPLLRFWKKAKFTCIYLSQVKNPLTGEHTCLLLKALNEDKSSREQSWLRPLWFDYRKRMLSLLQGPFRSLQSEFALSLVTNKVYKKKTESPPHNHLKLLVSQSGLKRLDAYTRHQCDLSRIVDIIPGLAVLHFRDNLPNCKLKALQSAILVGIGLQRKHPSVVAKEFKLETSILMQQVHSLLNDLNQILEDLWKSSSKTPDGVSDEEKNTTSNTDNNNFGKIAAEVAAEVTAEMEQNLKERDEGEEKITDDLDLKQFAIKGIESEVNLPTKKKKKKISLEDPKMISSKRIKR